MMKKISGKIKESAEILANRIAAPVKNKKTTFLFGAGINYNIAEGAETWDSLAFNSINDFVKKETNLSKNVAYAFSKELLKNFNNKLSLSLNDKVSINKIMPLPQSEVLWFKQGYEIIKNASNNNISIITFNYDRVLEKILFKKPVNLLKGNFDWKTASRDRDDEILHIHGLANDEGIVDSANSMLSIHDYVSKTDNVKEILEHFLNNQDDGFAYETIIIVGYSLTEEHVLQVLEKLNNKPNRMVEIFWVCYLPTENFIFKKLKQIYKKLNINILNINTNNDKTFKSNFIDLWGYIAKLINKSSIDIPDDIKEKISSENIHANITSEIYNIFVNKLKGNQHKQLSFDEAKALVGMDKLPYLPNLLNVLVWLEKDNLIKEGETKRYLFNCNPIPIEELYWIKGFNSEELNIVMESFEKKITNKGNDFYEPFNFAVHNLIEENFDDINFKPFPLTLSYLIKKTATNPREIHSRLAKKITAKFTLLDYTHNNDWSEIFSSIIEFDGIQNLRQIIDNTLKIKGDSFGMEIPKTLDEIPKLLFSLRDFAEPKKLLLFIFSIERYSKPLLSQVKQIKSSISKFNDEFQKNSNFQYYKHVYFVLLCRVFLNSSKEEVFISEIKELKGWFKTFPNAISYSLMAWSNGGEAFSKYDGREINEEVFEFNTWEEIVRNINNENFYFNQNFWNQFAAFLSKNHSLKDIDQLYRIKKLYLTHYNVGTVSVTLKLDKYMEYLKIRDDYFKEGEYPGFDYLKVSPDFDNDIEIDNYIKLIEADISNEFYWVTLKKHISIKRYNRFNVWRDSETNKLLMIYKKSNSQIHHVEDILNIIFSSVYGWEEGEFLRVIKSSKYTNWEEAQLFVRYKSKWDEDMPGVEDFLRYYKEAEQVDEKWHFEHLIFFLFANQKIKKSGWILNELKILTSENKKLNFEHVIKKIKYWHIWNFLKEGVAIPYEEISITKQEVAYFIQSISQKDFEEHSQKLSMIFINEKSVKITGENTSMILRMLSNRMTKEIADFLYGELSSELSPKRLYGTHMPLKTDIDILENYLSEEKFEKLKKIVNKKWRFGA